MSTAEASGKRPAFAADMVCRFHLSGMVCFVRRCVVLERNKEIRAQRVLHEVLAEGGKNIVISFREEFVQSAFPISSRWHAKSRLDFLLAIVRPFDQ